MSFMICYIVKFQGVGLIEKRSLLLFSISTSSESRRDSHCAAKQKTVAAFDRMYASVSLLDLMSLQHNEVTIIGHSPAGFVVKYVLVKVETVPSIEHISTRQEDKCSIFYQHDGMDNKQL